jgi:predicted SprT family Zn-dependent metalloprotease
MSRPAKQLVLDFGLSLLNRIRPKPQPTTAPRRKATALRADPILEEVSRVLLRQVGCRELAKVVSVWWNPRLKTTAGMACYRTRRVILNPKLIEVSAEEVQTTLRHELAHLIAQDRAGRRRVSPHGAEWHQACADLGIPDEARCHNLPFKQRRVTRKYFYSCRQCGTVLARVRPVKRRIACLKCCRKYNDGKYSDQFRFEQIPEPIAA